MGMKKPYIYTDETCLVSVADIHMADEMLHNTPQEENILKTLELSFESKVSNVLAYYITQLECGRCVDHRELAMRLFIMDQAYNMAMANYDPDEFIFDDGFTWESGCPFLSVFGQNKIPFMNQETIFEDMKMLDHRVVQMCQDTAKKCQTHDFQWLLSHQKPIIEELSKFFKLYFKV